MATEKYRDKARSKRCSLTARIETQGMRKATARRSWQRAEDTQSKNGSKPSGPQGCHPACRRPPCRSLNKQYGSGAAERMKNRSLFQKEQTREQHSVQRGTLTLFEMPGKSLLACPLHVSLPINYTASCFSWQNHSSRLGFRPCPSRRNSISTRFTKESMLRLVRLSSSK